MIRTISAAILLAGTTAATSAGWLGALMTSGIGGTAQFRAVAEGMAPSVPRSQYVGAGYYVIQLNALPSEATKAALEATGATLDEYVPHNAFLARLDARSVRGVRRVPGVTKIFPYAPAFRISPTLASELSAPTAANPILRGERIMVAVETFAGAQPSVASLARIEGGAVLAKSDGVMLISLPAAAVPRLLNADGVKWLDRAELPHLDNSVARVLMGADPAGTRRAPTSYLFGSGEVVAVLDTGLDTGNLTTVHQDIRGRIVGARAWAAAAWSDNLGHGTHVAGSVLGNGVLSGSNPGAHSYVGTYAGIAPEASLSFHAIASDSGSLDGLYSLTAILDAAYLDGARIASNSWGANTAGFYDYWSKLVDDYAFSHPDYLLIFAAGNAGRDLDKDGYIDAGSIGSPATAKNVLAVGASENNESGRSAALKLGLTYSAYGYGANPIGGDGTATNPSGMAAFSSRGPTQDGRIKPEVVAPGTAVISTKSSRPGVYYDKVIDANYAIDSGTSMATPLTAGAAAVVRQYLRSIVGIAGPPATLIKAVLMAGARDIAPGQYGNAAKWEVPTAPNSIEGVGRVDVAASTGPAIKVVASSASLAKGAATEYSVAVPGGRPDLRIVLTWSDPTASSTSFIKLVNDIDLEVTSPTGQKFYSKSRRDNFEGVFLKNPVGGTWKVKVIAAAVAKGPQNYSLAAFWRW